MGKGARKGQVGGPVHPSFHVAKAANQLAGKRGQRGPAAVGAADPDLKERSTQRLLSDLEKPPGRPVGHAEARRGFPQGPQLVNGFKKRKPAVGEDQTTIGFDPDL